MTPGGSDVEASAASEFGRTNRAWEVAMIVSLLKAGGDGGGDDDDDDASPRDNRGDTTPLLVIQMKVITYVCRVSATCH